MERGGAVSIVVPARQLDYLRRRGRLYAHVCRPGMASVEAGADDGQGPFCGADARAVRK